MSETERPVEPALPPLVDWDQIPLRLVNDVANFSFLGGLFDVILTTTFGAVDDRGQLQAQRLIAARLRFDLGFARAFHAQLGHAIDAVTAPSKDRVN